MLLRFSTARGLRGMRVPTWAAGSLIVASVAAHSAAWQPGASEGPDRLPSNLVVTKPAFRTVLVQMWQRSPTFRRQCERLSAAADHLRVTLFLDERARQAFAHAWTSVQFRNGRPVSADVYLRPSHDIVELVAHEIEHIIEQLDRVDLHARTAGGEIWRSDSRSFETRRAIEVGRRVAREAVYPPAVGEAEGTVPSDATGAGRLLMTVPQQDSRSHGVDGSSCQVSADGRHVAFASFAQLVPSDRNRFRDIYVLDLSTATVTLESAGFDGASADGESTAPAISADGRFVAFESIAGNLTARSVPPGLPRVFLRDRQSGETRLASVTPAGDPLDVPSVDPAISADGTTLVFASARVLASGDRVDGAARGLYLIRPGTGVRLQVDIPAAETRRSIPANGASISADGRYVAFTSRDDLTCGEDGGCAGNRPDRNGVPDIYVRDTDAGVTRRISRSRTGGDSNGPSYHAAISGDGRFIAFVSEASNLVRGTRKGVPHVYLHDTTAGITTLVSRTPRGSPANGASLRPAISHDGGIVAFQSVASNLVCETDCPPDEDDFNLVPDIFVHHVAGRRTIRASSGGRALWMEYSRTPSIDGSGRVLAFPSRHPAHERDVSHDEDLFIWRLVGGFAATAAKSDWRSR